MNYNYINIFLNKSKIYTFSKNKNKLLFSSKSQCDDDYDNSNDYIEDEAKFMIPTTHKYK